MIPKGKRQSTGYAAAILALLLGWIPAALLAQETAAEEIVVRFEVPRLFQKDISAQYRDGSLFLPLIEIFSLLSIKTDVDFEKPFFRGEFNTPKNKYEIDPSGGRAFCSGAEIALESKDYVLTAREIYLGIDIYDALFGLKMYFDFSNLSVYLPLNKEFPAYRRLLRRQAHQQLQEQAVARKDLVVIPPERERLTGGVADWVVTASPIGDGGHYGNLSLGGMLLGGDLTLEGAATSKTGFISDQFRYRWHYYFDRGRYLTQAELGDIYTNGILGRNLRGAMITNRPQIERRYFQTIDIAGSPGVGWEVELYINNRLTDFTYADENGDYQFLTDIMYGSSRIMLKMYGPNGEMETEERFVSVPYNFIPRGTFEYTLAAGETRASIEKGRFAQGMLFYGLLGSLTAGVSADIPLETEMSDQPDYAAEINYHPLGNLVLNGSVAPENSAKFSFTFGSSSVIGINGSYARYFENGAKNPLNQESGARISLSSPLRFGGFRIGLRYHTTYDRYRDFNRLNMSYGFNSSLAKFTLNYMGSYKVSRFTARTDRELTSQFIFSTMMLKWIRPQVRINYDHRQNDISGAGLYLTKRLFRTGQLSFSVERNMRTGNNLVMATFNIFTGFADFSTKLFNSGGNTAVSQTQRGSVRFDQSAGSFRFDRKNGLGYGAAVVWPFLDENFNGVLDNGEEVMSDLKAKIGGAYGKRRGKEGPYYYDNLRPYDKFTVSIDPYSLDNPQLQPAHENFLVAVMPNIVTAVNIPIVTAGEVAGTINRAIPDGQVGVGGINIIITNENTGKETKLTSFNSGEFYFLGLVPGVYRAHIDPEQLSRYGYNSEPPEISFQIKTVAGGDMINNLNFVISPRPDDANK